MPMDIAKPPRRRTARRLLWVGGGLLAVAATGLGAAVARRPRAPTIERASLWTGRVERGSFNIEIKGTGALEPEEIHWSTAETAGRVERRFVKPGAVVTAADPVVQLDNSELRLQALQAEREVAAMRLELIKLEHDLGAAALGEEAAKATLEYERDDVQRRAEAYASRSDLFAKLDVQQLSDHARELQHRGEIEKSKVQLLHRGLARKIAAQQAQIEQTVQIAKVRGRQVDELIARAGIAGVVEEVPVELGQWVMPGTTLAKVADPTHLKARLRVSELQAKDVAVGQKATVDLHTSTVDGRVARIAPKASGGTVDVEIRLVGTLPRGARPDLSIGGYIEAEHLDDVLQLPRPVGTEPEGERALYRIDRGRGLATRVSAQIGKTSVDRVEVRRGLAEGDEVILSDMTRWGSFDTVILK